MLFTWHRGEVSSMSSGFLDIFLLAGESPACDRWASVCPTVMAIPVFFPNKRSPHSTMPYSASCVWVSSAHIEEEKMKPWRGVGRWNPTFLPASDWGTRKTSHMLSSSSSKYDDKYNGMYYTHNPPIRTEINQFGSFVSEKLPQPASTSVSAPLLAYIFTNNFSNAPPAFDTWAFLCKLFIFLGHMGQRKHFTSYKGCTVKARPRRTQVPWEQEFFASFVQWAQCLTQLSPHQRHSIIICWTNVRGWPSFLC